MNVTGPHTYAVDCPAVFLTPNWAAHSEVADVIDCGDVFDVAPASRAFSLCARVRLPPEGTTEGGYRILSKGELPQGWRFSAGPTVSFAVALPPEPVEAEEAKEDAGEEEFSTQAPLPSGQAVGSTALADGEWHHVAVVVQECGEVSLFVDGCLDSAPVALQVKAAPDQPLLLGPPESAVTAGVGVKDVQACAFVLTPQQIHGLATGSKDLGTGLSLSLMPEQVTEYRRLKAEDSEGGEGGEGSEAARALLTAAGLGDHLGRAFQQEVVLDLFDDLMACAESMCLTARKTAVMVRILEQILEMMHVKSKSAKRLGETSSIYECFQEFKRLLLAHSFAATTSARKLIDRNQIPADSTLALGVFTLSEVRLLTEFLTGALFQQFLLYQCVLVSPQDQVTSMVEVIVPPPTVPPNLATAKKKQKGAKGASEKVGIRDSGTAKRNSLPRLSKQSGQPEAEEAEEAAAIPVEAKRGPSLDETLAQLPQDLSVDAHHEEATKAAEVTADTAIKQHDKELSPQ
ncbi:unnamed protein product [Symbiodinium pilosum]|uniref:Uncharacterized protein n=1 Tax=Symbiodinium pilosum TaxID=2952 RepID=A0A812RYF1_SYMPI|nr:unnamed protein product [Symbiodinium pilosum]